ncbi:MAG: sulfurtransferase TusA family protein [Gammaproteobacteria bacterium]|nr:sulfurtransferase TusA family protein [Gammaproteobacteria bacterium]
MADEKAVEVDATGLDCPMPLLQAKRALNNMESGQCLKVLATDSSSVRDFQVFCDQAGHALLSSGQEAGVYRFLLRKR